MYFYLLTLWCFVWGRQSLPVIGWTTIASHRFLGGLFPLLLSLSLAAFSRVTYTLAFRWYRSHRACCLFMFARMLGQMCHLLSYKWEKKVFSLFDRWSSGIPGQNNGGNNNIVIIANYTTELLEKIGVAPLWPFLIASPFYVTYLPTSVRFGHWANKWPLALHSVLVAVCVCVLIVRTSALSLTLSFLPLNSQYIKWLFAFHLDWNWCYLYG